MGFVKTNLDGSLSYMTSLILSSLIICLGFAFNVGVLYTLVRKFWRRFNSVKLNT
jgi:hypothetical protein